MKKFFKFGSSKKKPTDLHGPSSPHRRSLVSIGSSVSGSESVGWGSFSSNVDAIKGYQIDPSRDKSLTKLHKACWTGDLDSVKKQTKKIDVNQVDSESRTPLHLAAARAHKDVIWFLLGSKAKPNLPDIDGNTPLLKAVQCVHADIVQFLLERGADPKASDVNGNTGLHHAACNGHQDIAFSLIQKGANINAKNEDGTTPLIISTIHRQLDMTELLLRHGASLNISDKGQKTCLMFACEKGYNELVEIFVQHGVDVNAANNVGHTAEDIAKLSGHDECVSTLNNFRLRQNSARKNEQEHQIDDTVMLTKRTSDNFNSESDEQSRASQVDLNADFNGSDLDSWNDDVSEASMQNAIDSNEDRGVGVDLSKFLACNKDLSHSETSDVYWYDNHHESPKILQHINDLQKSKGENRNERKENQKSKEIEVTVADVPLVSDNESGSLLQKSVTAFENVSNSDLRNDRAFLAELGLSDVSEVSTPTFSGFSVKDEARKDVDTDVEDDEIKFDIPNMLAVAVVQKEVPKDASLLKASPEDNVDIKAENGHLQSNEHNTLLARASQTMGSLQTVYVSVKKNGSFNGDDSDTDWDDESEDNNVDGPIHIHPILLKKMSKDESHSNQMLQNDGQVAKIKKREIAVDPICDNSFPASAAPQSTGPSVKGQEIEVSTNPPSNVMSSEGTLGRPGTMQEVEEMWVKNPSLEIVKEAIPFATTNESQSFVKEEAQPCVKEGPQHYAKDKAQSFVVEEAQSVVKQNLAEDVDSIYHAELALVNSQDTSRSNTLDEHQKKNFNDNALGNDAEINNSEALSVEQLWDHIWLQICGKLKKENDTESSDENSSVPVTDQENRDSSFSSPDIDQSVASARDDVMPYQLLTSFIKDPNYSWRVINLVQHIRLAWQKEQDKSKIFIDKIKLLKGEAQKMADKNRLLNASKVDAENDIHRLEAELESAKHALKNQENVCANVELELDRSKTRLLMMEEKLFREVSIRQQAELLANANQEEAKMNQDLMIQLSTQISNKVSLSADFCCQTDESPSDNSLVPLPFEKAELQSEIVSLQQQVDSLTLSLSQQSKLKDQLETLQKELILKEKDLAQLNQNLTESKRECSVKLLGEKMLNTRLEELHEDYLIISTKVLTTEEKNGQLSKDLAVASNNFEECNLKISLLEKEIQTVKAKEERLQLLLKAQMNENEQLKQETIDLKNRLTRLQSDYAKIKFELDNGTNLQQLSLDQEESRQQIIKTKDEKYVAIVTDNEKLKHQIEEFKEQELLNVQKVNVLIEKLLHANFVKAEVSDLQSQLAIANNKSSLAEMKIGELKKQLLEEQTAGLRFLTIEKELEETRKNLNLANDMIAARETLLADAQENEKKHQNQLQNERQGTMLQLQDADNKIKEICNELDGKNKMIQDLTVRLEHCTKSVDYERPTSIVEDQNEKHYDFGKSCSNVEGDNVDMNHSLQGMAIDSTNNWLEDVTMEANQGWQEIQDGMLSTSKFSKYDETLKQLQEQVEELRKQSMEGKETAHNDQSLPKSSNTRGLQSVHVIAAESLNHQINLLGKKLQEERQQKEEYQVQINVHKQQLSKANAMLKRAVQMQHIQNRFDGSAGILKNPADDVDVEFMRHDWEIGARRELNQQLNKINKFLEDRSLANDHLEQLHREREIKLHREYQRAVRDLRFEVQQLHDELQEKESNRKVLEEQNQHRRKLNAARKRVKAKLRDHAQEKTNSLGTRLHTNHLSHSNVLLSSSYPEHAMTSLYGMSGLVPGSPVINNLKSFKDLEGAFSVKLGFDREPVVARQLSGSAAFDSLFKSNINLSLDKTTTEYLDALKKNYLL